MAAPTHKPSLGAHAGCRARGVLSQVQLYPPLSVGGANTAHLPHKIMHRREASDGLDLRRRLNEDAPSLRKRRQTKSIIPIKKSQPQNQKKMKAKFNSSGGIITPAVCFHVPNDPWGEGVGSPDAAVCSADERPGAVNNPLGQKGDHMQVPAWYGRKPTRKTPPNGAIM